MLASFYKSELNNFQALSQITKHSDLPGQLEENYTINEQI